jgi:NAD(P)-dependent dehydrogenase (short-subunit alcohol dehydrogenase family)
MSFGPAEAFTPKQFAQLYDINVLSTQRVNRAALPHMRKHGSWSGGVGVQQQCSWRYAALSRAVLAMDSLAVSYASELSRWGIETSVIVPGAFTKGTNHFAHSGSSADKGRTAEYDNGPYAGIPEQALKGLVALEPADADAATVADAIVQVVDMPFGQRPFRTHIDPSQDGCEIVNGVADRVRAEMFRRIGLENLLRVQVKAGAAS